MIGDGELRKLVSRLPHGIVAVERDLRVVFANLPAQRLFHPVPLRVGARLTQGPFDLDITAFARGLFGGTASALEQFAESESETFRVVGIPPHGDGYATIVLDDVTRRSAGERARAEFVANAAHELLTPLTGIVSAAHVLEAGAKDVPEIRDRFIAHISRECDRLTRIARSLLTLARAQSGEEPPRPEIVDLRSVLDGVLVGGLEEKVLLHCPSNVTAFVDRDLAETALSNLVSNAVRHSADGNVSISVDEAAEDGHIGVVISSAARGASPGDSARLQRRFVSGAGRDGGGFGLGISIATQAVEAVGGTLAFDSDGNEMHVRVELPAGGGDEHAHPRR